MFKQCPDTSGIEDLTRDFIALWFGHNFTLEKVKTLLLPLTYKLQYLVQLQVFSCITLHSQVTLVTSAGA